MTPDLAELRRLADEATEAHAARDSAGRPRYARQTREIADQRFLKAAWSAVPALCDEVDRLRGLLDRCETVLAKCAAMPDGPTPSAAMLACRDAARAVLAEPRAAPADETKG